MKYEITSSMTQLLIGLSKEMANTDDEEFDVSDFINEDPYEAFRLGIREGKILFARDLIEHLDLNNLN